MPDWPYNDERTTDRTAIDQCRVRRNGELQACIDAIPQMGAILSECAEVGWKAFETRCCACLLEGLGGTPKELGRNISLAAEIDDRQAFEGGDEHYILLPGAHATERVLKWTYGDNFGLRLKVFEHDPELMNHHVISSGNNDPRYYLRRFMILNRIGPPITRFEGIIPPDFLGNERLPRLVISQRELNPENPSLRDIVRCFREIGFVEVSEHSYYRKEDNILLGDAAPKNVRIENGVIIPFDAVAEHPEGSALEWCIGKTRNHPANSPKI